MKEKLGRRILLSRLEGVITKYIENNGKQIRYPISFPENLRLRGSNTILNVENVNIENMKKAKYIFGANHLYIFAALDEILDVLEAKSDGEFSVDCICYNLEEQADDEA